MNNLNDVQSVLLCEFPHSDGMTYGLWKPTSLVLSLLFYCKCTHFETRREVSAIITLAEQKWNILEHDLYVLSLNSREINH
jgi:hypothetical protein